MGSDDVIVTICTDAIDRYHSVMAEMTAHVRQDGRGARRRRALDSIFHGQKTDWIHEGTPEMRRQWHNLKYYTWVEQQGKTVEELDAQRNPDWWLREQAKVAEIDKRIKATRK